MNSFPDLEPVCCSMSSSNCSLLSCIEISLEAGQIVWYSHLFKNFPQFVVIHTVKGFGVLNKAKVDVFLKLSCFFDDSADVGYLISASSAFSKSTLSIWSSWFTNCWSLAWRILSVTLLVCERSILCDSLNIIWDCLSWDWNENWPFPVLWLLLSFVNLLAYWVQHFHSIIF